MSIADAVPGATRSVPQTAERQVGPRATDRPNVLSTSVSRAPGADDRPREVAPPPALAIATTGTTLHLRHLLAISHESVAGDGRHPAAAVTVWASGAATFIPAAPC